MTVTDPPASDPELPLGPLASSAPAFEALFAGVVVAVQGGDPDRIEDAWRTAERTLTERLEREERTELAGLYASRPQQVRALLAEHAHLRRRLAQLRSTLPLPSIDAVRDLVGELRAHASHKQAVYESART